MNRAIPERFSDEQAKDILARAIELDSRALATSLDELRAIASDIGVTPASLETAIREHAITLNARRMVGTRRVTSVIAATGIPIGIAGGALLASGAPFGLLAALGLMAVGLVASGGIVVFQGTAGTLRSFHLKNLVLWGGVAVGGALSAAMSGGVGVGVPMLITAGWCLRSWVASSILGSTAVIAIRRARRPDGSEPGDAALGNMVDSEARGWRTVVRRVIGWLTRPLKRVDAAPPLKRAEVQYT
jgi:hypothetical protein